MLILTRRVGETVMIGNDVTVTVLGVKGNQVRIGVNAPRDVAVHREEIFERRCASCHSLSRTKKLLNDVSLDERAGYLVRFLRSHPSRLDDNDEKLVIEVLSQPGG